MANNGGKKGSYILLTSREKPQILREIKEIEDRSHALHLKLRGIRKRLLNATFSGAGHGGGGG
jgi:hypothetical protein